MRVYSSEYASDVTRMLEMTGSSESSGAWQKGHVACLLALCSLPATAYIMWPRSSFLVWISGLLVSVDCSIIFSLSLSASCVHLSSLCLPQSMLPLSPSPFNALPTCFLLHLLFSFLLPHCSLCHPLSMLHTPAFISFSSFYFSIWSFFRRNFGTLT